MIAIMLALLIAGIAAVALIVQPAHDEYDRTRREEARLRRELAKEEAERTKLEILARGLDQDPRVIERVLRNQGAGKLDEVRYARAVQDSRPTR